VLGIAWKALLIFWQFFFDFGSLEESAAMIEKN